MLKIKGIYKNGEIHLKEPIPKEILSADISIFFEPNDKEDELLVNKNKIKETSQNNSSEFKKISIETFLYFDDDSDLDWEEHFGIK